MMKNLQLQNICDEILFLASQGLDGELSLQESKKVNAHLEGCPSCLKEKNNLEELHHLTCSMMQSWSEKNSLSKTDHLNQKILYSLGIAPAFPSSFWHIFQKTIPLIAASLVAFVYLSFSFFAPMSGMYVLKKNIHSQNFYDNSTFGKRTASLLVSSHSSLPSFILRNDFPAVKKAKKRWNQHKWQKDWKMEVEKVKDILQHTKWDQIQLFATKPSIFIHRFNSFLSHKPYLILLSSLQTKSLLLKKEKFSFPEVIQFLENRWKISHCITPDFILLGYTKDIEKFCKKFFPFLKKKINFTIPPNRTSKKIKINQKNITVNGLAEIVYKTKKIKIYFTKETAKNIRLLCVGTSFSLENFLKNISKKFKCKWQWDQKNKNTLYVFQTTKNISLNKTRAKINQKIEDQCISFIRRVRKTNQLKVFLKHSKKYQLYALGDQIGEIKLIKLQNSRVFFMYKGFLFFRTFIH